MTKVNQAEIEAAFVKLLSERPLSEIGVAEIAEACGINRNTFYYHYHNIADLINSVVRNMTVEILRQHPPTFTSLEDCFTAAIELAGANKVAILNIYNSTSRAIFERHLWRFCNYAVESYLDCLPRELSPRSPAERQIISDVLRFEMFGFTMDWVGRQMTDDILPKIRLLVEFLKQNLQQQDPRQQYSFYRRDPHR